MLLFVGCRSFSGERGSASVDGNPEELIQFAAAAYVCTLNRDDKQVQFIERQLRLTSLDLAVGSSGTREERIQLRDIDSIALYPGDVTHPYQLQVQYDKRLFVIQVLGAARNNDDLRTQQLYEQMALYGVPRARTEQFFYVGMDLEDVKSSGGDGFFAAAAGARLGGFIWDSIKGLGSLLIKPFVPLF